MKTHKTLSCKEFWISFDSEKSSYSYCFEVHLIFFKTFLYAFYIILQSYKDLFFSGPALQFRVIGEFDYLFLYAIFYVFKCIWRRWEGLTPVIEGLLWRLLANSRQPLQEPRLLFSIWAIPWPCLRLWSRFLWTQLYYETLMRSKVECFAEITYIGWIPLIDTFGQELQLG